jgi:hypothetical protein
MAKSRCPIAIAIAVALVSLASMMSAADADIRDLCKKIDCGAVKCVTPKISAVMPLSNFTPGGVVAVKGCGFGEKGSLRLVLVDHKGATKAVWLDVLDWTDRLVGATVPADVLHVSDQTARLLIVTKAALRSNDVTVSFRASRDVKKLPMDDVHVMCSTEADVDLCNGKEGSSTPFCFKGLGTDTKRSVSGRHYTCHDWFGDDTGTDIYFAALKNGWTFHSHTWTEHTARDGVNGVCSQVHPSGLTSGSAGIKVSVDWITCNYRGLAAYDLDLFITGPAGVPHN